MNIKLQLPTMTELKPRLTVIGVGGAGSNAVNNMIASGLTGVNFVVANTDAQSIANSAAEHRVQLGVHLTEGLGAGAKPEVGKAAAEEAIEELRAQIAGSHMVFIAAGMGGGTGTGAASVVARVARESGALTVGVVTKPFQFEGARRMRAAEVGIAALRPNVDTLIVIPNQNLFRIANEKTTFSDAFVLADQVLYSGIACIVDLIVKEGLINLDFADVRTIMSNMGTAMMGTGEASGDRRAVQAAEEAICNPLLDDISLRGAKGLLISITGGRDLTLYEVDEAATRVRQEIDPEANIIVGANFDDNIGDRIRVSIVASGMERLSESGQSAWAPAPQAAEPHRALMAPPAQLAPADHAVPQAVLEPIGAQHAAFQVQATPESAQQPYQQHAAPQPQMGEAHGYPPQGQGQVQSPDTELAQALQQAIGAAAAQPQAMLPPALPPQAYHPAQAPLNAAAPPHQASRAPWTAPGGAVFEDAPPPVAHAPAPPPGVEPQFERLAASDVPFTPQAPAEVRRAPRRLPDVEDFPVVGQREYRAKMEQYADPPPAPPRAYQHAPPEPPRKLGFFERLTGAKRKAPAKPAEPARPPSSYPQAHKAGDREPDQALGNGRQRAGDAPATGSRRGEEGSDLPVFFGNERK